MDLNTQRFLDVASNAALEAGSYLRERFKRVNQISFKGERDPVSQADIEAEKIILEVLNQQFPSFGFLGEESGLRDGHQPLRWIIDPLDGTMNFIHGIAQFGVSIALQNNNRTIVGVVYQPLADELYAAIDCCGAYLNGEKLKVSSSVDLSECVLGTGFGTSVSLRLKQQALLGQFLLQCGAIREIGSAALGLCYVACGNYAGYWELGLNLWDIAAGELIVTEAGGTVTNLGKTSFSTQTENILASNGLVHQMLLEQSSDYEVGI